MKIPRPLDLTETQSTALIERLKSQHATAEDLNLCADLVNFCSWLQLGLSTAELNLATLRKLFNILPTDKKKL